MSTWRKFYRRLLKLIYEGRGILRRDDRDGRPLDLVRADTSDPIVIDLSALAGTPELQRFVVATIFRQLKEARTGTNRITGLTYLVTLDELNRFAPRGARDPITQLIETIAAEMRSQGIILLGAQQHASRVSERVVESAAIQVLGRTGAIELNSPSWRGLSKSAQSKAMRLPPDEKLVIQDNFREPMHVRVPFPVWAMNPSEALRNPPDGVSNDGTVNNGDTGRQNVTDFSDSIDDD
jgi:DNA helicase HerA-like ATPase